MSCKLPGIGARGAAGYWGRSPYKRIQLEAVPQKERILLQDKLIAMGRPVYLWTLRETGDTCTCSKDTASRADTRCRSCYGVGLVPGYTRFLTENLWWSSSLTTGFAMTDTVVDTVLKPNRVRLTDSVLTGTVVTTATAFSNANLDAWEVELNAYSQTSTDTLTLEWSTGGAYTAVALTQASTYAYRGSITGASIGASGSLRFRVTMTRASTSTDSPQFEVLRTRHVQSPLRCVQIQVQRPDVPAGAILVLKSWSAEQTLRHIGFGRQTDMQGDHSWTAPLDWFNTSLTINTPSCIVRDRGAGFSPFLQPVVGVNTTDRYVMTQFSYSELATNFLVHQEFTERRAQSNEAVWDVW